MKFKLINENTRGLNAKPSQDLVNEELLTEKQWVEVRSNAPRPITFYFYATDTNPAADVNTLIPLINGTQTGTYKQQIDRNILNTLKNEYKLVGPTFNLNIISTGVPTATALAGNVITLMDRDLRKEGNNIGKAGVSALTGNSNVLVHHKNGREGDNTSANLMVFEGGNPNSAILAKAGHAAAHTLRNFAGISPAAPFHHSINVYEDNGAGFIRTHTIEMTIT